jgi:hypothetical protein
MVLQYYHVESFWTVSTDRPQNHVKIAVPWWTNYSSFGRYRAWKFALWISERYPAEAELATSKQFHARDRLTLWQHERKSCKRSPLQRPGIRLPLLYGSVLRRISRRYNRIFIPSFFVDGVTAAPEDEITDISLRMSWFCHAFWWRDSNIYLVFSVFTSRPTYLLASIKVCVFFFMVSTLSPSRFTSSA